MTTISGDPARPPILAVDPSKGPWGDDPNKPGGPGPRNPWAQPPGGRRGPAKPSALDEFLKRTRGGGGGSGGGFSGFPTPSNPKALWAIGLGIVIAAWLLLTSFHQIGPQERGVMTYFGRYAGTLAPGIQFTPPAPIASVRKYDVSRVRTENFPRGDGANLTLTGEQNIVDLTYSVQWNIADPKDYAFELAQPEATVRAAAESAMRAVIATTTLDQALGSGRTTIEGRVAEQTQALLNSYRAGVRIQGVSINRAAAPEQIVEDFNKVTVAQQEAVAEVNRARAYAQQVVSKARGEAGAFDRVYAEYKLAPEVTRRRMYYETMEKVLARSDKTVIEQGGVMPYLPLNQARRLPEAAPATPAAGSGAMNALSFRNPLVAGILALVLVILAAATFAIVPETQQAVVYRLGQPVRDINRYRAGEQLGATQAGLILRIPFVERVTYVEKRVLDLDLENTPVLSTDQQRLNVDAFARFRVVDPRLMLRTAGSEEGVVNQLRPLFGSTLRNELGKVSVTALLSAERGRVMEAIQTGLERRARQYGVEIVDVRIKQAELPEGTPLQSALARMQSARQQEATSIQSEGQRRGAIIRADADAEAARIYAGSFGKDADFYDFYRAMQSYNYTFGRGNQEGAGSTSFVLSPNNSYLKEFEGRGR